LDGSDGIINPLQVYRADDKSNYKEEQASFEQYEKQCFMQHISKVAIFYEFLAGSPSTEEIEVFKKVLRMFYDYMGFMKKIKTVSSIYQRLLFFMNSLLSVLLQKKLKNLKRYYACFMNRWASWRKLKQKVLRH